MAGITQEQVRDLFDVSSGELIRKTSPVHNALIGDIAGSKNQNGYFQTRINGTLYTNHRLIWLWYYGYWPENDIDHINRIKTDNRIENLREVSRTCNMRNRKPNSNNMSGVKGISWKDKIGKWVVQIAVNTRKVHIGYFEDFVEAVAHRLAAEQCCNWSNCDNNSQAFQYIINWKINKDE